MIVLVMGVSGCGKSTVGRRLADRLGAVFLEADEFHPPANVAKMRDGVPLTDEDRWPWLDALAAAIDAAAADGDVVVACSALRRTYRERLLGRHRDGARIVHLHGSPELIAERLRARTGHYMPPSLLPTQIATLEAPDDALVVDIAQPPEDLVEGIARAVLARQA